MQVRISNIESKSKLQSAVCVLPISVGQPYHEEAALEGTLKLIRYAGFAKCIIVVADTLQRHNFLIRHLADSTLPPSDAQARAMNAAKEAGDEWLRRNQPYINQHLMGFEYEILRWDDCLAYPEFSQKLSLLNDQYQDRSSNFSRSVNKICGQRISYYLKNQMIDSSDSHISATRDLTKSYVCEEGAIMLQWRDLGYQYMAYPSSHNPINKEIFDCLGSILQQNGGMELLNIEISEVKKQPKKTKKQVPLSSPYSNNISLTEKQSQKLKKAIQDFVPLAINPIFTALRNLHDPSLILLFLRAVQDQLLEIEENTKKTSVSMVSDNLPSSFSSQTSSAMFHLLPSSSCDETTSLHGKL